MADNRTALDRLVHPDGHLTIGLELPLDNDRGPTRLAQSARSGRHTGIPDLSEHTSRAQLADRLGFAAL